MTSTKRRLAPLQNAQQCQRFTPGWTCDRIYEEWQTQGPKIQQQQRKEATATPIIKIAESIRRWAHRYQKLQPVLIGLTFAGELAWFRCR